ncbi:MAG: hypothetical protein OHK0013_13910 [Sandaracinaceae bacterium]
MIDASVLLSFVAWAFLPGYCIVRLAAPWLRRSVGLTMAPGLSVALVSLVAYATDAAGLGARPFPVAGGLVAIALGAALVHRVRTHRWRPEVLRKEPAWALAAPLGAGLAVLALTTPLRTLPVLPPTLHDGLDHATWFRFVLELGRVDRYVISAPPFGPGGEPTFYPLGFHAFAAMVAQTSTADPIVAFTEIVHLLAACIPLGVYAWVARLDTGIRVAAVASWLAIGFYWVPFQLLAWGGLAMLAGLVCMLPLAISGLEALAAPRGALVPLSVLFGLGTLLVHPSEAMGALFIAFLGSLFAARGQRPLWIPAVVLGSTLVAIVLATELFADAWPPLASFLAKAHAEAPALRREDVWGWPMRVYLPPSPPGVQMSETVVALAAMGALAAVLRPRAQVFLFQHLALSVLLGFVSFEPTLTALWYHAPERLWYLQIAAVPGLAAVGLEVVIEQLDWRTRPLGRSAHRVALAVVPVALAVAAVTFVDRVSARVIRWARSPQAFLDHRALADFAWIREHVPADARILNTPADHGIVTAMTGRRAVFWAGGVATPEPGKWGAWALAMSRPSRFTPALRDELRARGIRYVYAASYAPWNAPPETVRVDVDLLASHPATALLYRSDSGAVLELTDAPFRLEDVPRASRPWSFQRVQPLDYPGSVRFVGFYPVERLLLEDGSEEVWRWAGRESRVVLTRFHLEPGCWLEMEPAEIRPHRLEVNGTPVVPSEHPIPDARLGAVLEIEVRSETFQAPGDPRTLGVQLGQAGLVCRPDGGLARAELAPGEAPWGLLEGHVQAIEGLWERERTPSGRRFRWTDGRARFRFDTGGIRGPCAFYVAYEGTRTGTVWLDGEQLAPVPGRYVLPESVRPERPVTLAITATAPYVPDPVEHNGDTRELGVRLDALNLRCWD